MTNAAIVQQLFSAIEGRDKVAVLSFFEPRGIFHNMPMEPRVGHEAIWQELAQVLDICDAVQWVVHAIAEDNEGRVLTERTDRFRINGTWVEFKVMGIFELRNGLVHHWRDYFDLQQGLAALGAATGS